MNSIHRVGGAASLLVAAAYLASALAFLLQPAELRGQGSAHEFWSVLAAGAPAHLVLHWTSAAAGVLGLAVVPAALRVSRERSEGWALWAAALGYLGFAVTARSHLMEVEFDLRVAAVYPGLEPATQASVPLIAGLALDVPHGWLTLGGIGVWVLVTSLLGSRQGALPHYLVWLGAAVALTLFAAVAGFSSANPLLILLGVGLGGSVLAPVWFVAFGVALLRAARA